MSKVTITEALAELKTIGKRLEKKQEFVIAYLMRPENVRDPLQKEGGTESAVSRELQSIQDLENRVVSIRRAIQIANETNNISVGNQTRSIADWLVWRREVAPWHGKLLAAMRGNIDRVRNEAIRRGAMLQPTVEAAKPGDVIVNISEQWLSTQIESLEEILGTLDGQLSLKNATVTVEF